MTDNIRPPHEESPYRPGSQAQAVLATQAKHRTNRYVFLARALAFLLAGYLLFDRTFAWIHFPGNPPLFVGEVVLAIGLYVAFRSKEVVRFIRLSSPMQLLMLFMAFGALLTVIGVTNYDPQTAVRDAAIWYYGLFALVIGSLAKAWEPAYDFFIRNYLRIIPAFLVIGLVRLVFANRQDAWLMPDSQVPITSHKPGNLGIQAIMVVAFLLLVVAPEMERRVRIRNAILAVGGLLLLALAGTQNRGALVAGSICLLIVYFPGRSARPLMGGVLVVVLATMVLAFAFNVTLELERRTVSVGQLVENFLSFTAPAGEDGTIANDGTIAWRLELWDLVLEDTISGDRFLSGFGFGPNLALRYGFIAGAGIGPELRNPHNSHLSVIARKLILCVVYIV